MMPSSTLLETLFSEVVNFATNCCQRIFLGMIFLCLLMVSLGIISLSNSTIPRFSSYIPILLLNQLNKEQAQGGSENTKEYGTSQWAHNQGQGMSHSLRRASVFASGLKDFNPYLTIWASNTFHSLSEMWTIRWRLLVPHFKFLARNPKIERDFLYSEAMGHPSKSETPTVSWFSSSILSEVSQIELYGTTWTDRITITNCYLIATYRY